MEQWLAVIDAGNYAESWSKAGADFQAALTQKSWEQACNTVRKPLGAVKSRIFQSATYQHGLEGVTGSDYIILKFRTSFENQASAVETVSSVLEKDGQWRCDGYLIRPGS